MQEWKVLAQRGESGRISRCPGGHIHLDYGNVTLRLGKEEFGAFAAMVQEARANLDGTPSFAAWVGPSALKGAAGFSNN